jgi:site-specific DNA-methyltransferase (adenine-specific)
MKYPDDFVNKIICGDCLDVMRDIPDKSIDLILTDPPYGITACQWDKVVNLDKMWTELKRIGKENCVFVFVSSLIFAVSLIRSNPKWFRYEWIWNKVNGSNFLNLKNRPFKTHELILVFSKNSSFVFNPKRVWRTEKSLKRDPVGNIKFRKLYSFNVEYYGIKRNNTLSLKSDGLKHPTSILTFTVHEKGRYEFKHPTKKPVALFEYLVRTYSDEDNLVLDCFAGSGTTGVACKNLNRNFILIEKEGKYCEVARKRILTIPDSLF